MNALRSMTILAMAAACLLGGCGDSGAGDDASEDNLNLFGRRSDGRDELLREGYLTSIKLDAKFVPLSATARCPAGAYRESDCVIDNPKPMEILQDAELRVFIDRDFVCDREAGRFQRAVDPASAACGGERDEEWRAGGIRVKAQGGAFHVVADVEEKEASYENDRARSQTLVLGAMRVHLTQGGAQRCGLRGSFTTAYDFHDAAKNRLLSSGGEFPFLCDVTTSTDPSLPSSAR